MSAAACNKENKEVAHCLHTYLERDFLVSIRHFARTAIDVSFPASVNGWRSSFVAHLWKAK